jgi:hypothetical protein
MQQSDRWFGLNELRAEDKMNRSREFAHALIGVTLRQYHTATLGGSWQKVLEFLPGVCLYYEIHRDSTGGGYTTEREQGQWTASGNFPMGGVQITWADGSATSHTVEYHGGNSCRFDGIVTAVE